MRVLHKNDAKHAFSILSSKRISSKNKYKSKLHTSILYRNNMKKIIISALTLLAAASGAVAQTGSVLTQRQYLSGHGCDDMVQWDFYCTGGNNSGKWTKIGVPSCWELQGFGTYQYGMKFYGKAFPEGVADEKGMYKYEFKLPKEWANHHIELVFEASMTDTQVMINKRKAGSKHMGAFYRITYDVSDRVFFGDKKNLLEVTVSKESENAGVNLAERRADYWNFGGIFRPVFIVCKPALNIERTAINATADGEFNAYVLLNHVLEGAKIKTTISDMNGKKVAENTTPVRHGSDHADVAFKVNNPKLWTAETPNRYKVDFALIDANGKTLHIEKDKFGFRTIETRESDGLYINGKKVNIRGVNRHSFRPESGRTLSYQKNLEDVELIKSMNMNAVRLSHYPADPEFYDICDSLGLYVMDELSGWHGHHETVNGQKLIREMVTRDVNHPSIIWWSNGNEKGWNTELDCEFHKWDVQKRPVLHPQGNFSGYETMHYRSYGESNEYMRKPEIWMPTEFLHALYDGGAGAGLYDYWEVMRKWPRCAGGFIWALVDEGVKRVDMGGMIDNVGNYGADGIVGPHHEPEGSYYTVKQIWCPVQVFMPDNFNGTLNVENRYNFLSLKGVTFDYEYVKYANAQKKTLKNGTVHGIDIAADSYGQLSVGAAPKDADALIVEATDQYKKNLFTWTFKLKDSDKLYTQATKGNRPQIQNGVVKAGKVTYTFNTEDGTLKSVQTGKGDYKFNNGPKFFAYRRTDRSMDQFYNHDDPEAEKKKTTYTEYAEQGKFDKLTATEGTNDTLIVTATYKLGSLQKAEWHIAPDGGARLVYTYLFNGVVDLMGVKFDLPEDEVKHKEWLGMGPYRVWKNRIHGPQLGLWGNDYNDPIPGESFDYPEFKGYFAGVQWMKLQTKTGTITMEPGNSDKDYVGVYQPRDGRDQLLYTLPETGISMMQVIPAVRNKVNTTDLNGPSALPVWSNGSYTGEVTLHFD